MKGRLSKEDYRKFKYSQAEKKKKFEVYRASLEMTLPSLPQKINRKEYFDYLVSDKWKSIKSRLFILRGKYCEVCCSEQRIQVHHLNYDRLYRENYSDLVILCESCHKKVHEK